MPETYAYRVRDSRGKLVTGVLIAQDKMAAANQLQEHGYFIIDIAPASAQRRKPNFFLWETKVGAKDLALFCRQFATMVTAGVPMLNCLTVLANQSENKKLAAVSKKIFRYLEEGHTLTEAVQLFPAVFPGIFTGLIKAGEKSGALDQSLKRLALHFEKEYEIKEKIKVTVSYPIIVAIVSLVAVIVLLAFVLPALISMLIQQNVSLPFSTRAVISVSHFTSAHWRIILLVLIVLYCALKRLAATERGKLLIDRILITTPVFGTTVKKINISRFSRTLSTLIRSGIPIIQAIDIVKGTVTNSIVAQALENAKNDIKNGLGITEGLINSNIFPPMVIQMVKVGENTGELDVLLEQVADFYEQDVNNTLAKMINLLEPLLVLFVGSIVGIIVSAALLPVIKVIGTVP